MRYQVYFEILSQISGSKNTKLLLEHCLALLKLDKQDSSDSKRPLAGKHESVLAESCLCIGHDNSASWQRRELNLEL